jgi:hypothetical protein
MNGHAATDLFGYVLLPSCAPLQSAPLVNLMDCPDALWLCRMGTPVDEALKEVGARNLDQSTTLI